MVLLYPLYMGFDQASGPGKYVSLRSSRTVEFCIRWRFTCWIKDIYPGSFIGEVKEPFRVRRRDVYTPM
jgi:hypothetical protein